MKFTDFFFIAYPLSQSFFTLKAPRLKNVNHWLIYWFIYTSLQITEILTFEYIPFWSLIKPFLLIINWFPMITELSWKFIDIAIKHIRYKLKNTPQLQDLYSHILLLWNINIDPIIVQYKLNPFLNLFITFFTTQLDTQINELSNNIPNPPASESNSPSKD